MEDSQIPRKPVTKSQGFTKIPKVELIPTPLYKGCDPLAFTEEQFPIPKMSQRRYTGRDSC